MIARDLPDEPMLIHEGITKSNRLRLKNPTPPGGNSSTQQQDSAFAIHVNIPRIGGIFVVYGHIGAGSRSQFDEPPNTQKLPESGRITVPDHPMPFLMAGATVEPGHMQSESAVGWLEHAWFAPDPDIVAGLDRVFGAANDEMFEDGMDSIFSASLNRIIHTHGTAAINALDRIIRTCQVNVATIEEALRHVGRIDDAQTHNRRLSLLEHALESPNARIRDAASIGIAAMDDPAAVPGLQKAVAKEQYEQLRQNLIDVLTQLQDNQ